MPSLCFPDHSLPWGMFCMDLKRMFILLLFSVVSVNISEATLMNSSLPGSYLYWFSLYFSTSYCRGHWSLWLYLWVFLICPYSYINFWLMFWVFVFIFINICLLCPLDELMSLFSWNCLIFGIICMYLKKSLARGMGLTFLI